MELRLRPDYRLIILCDADSDADEGLADAIGRAGSGIAVATDWSVVISVAQDLIAVDVRLVYREGTPGPAEPLEFDIDLPTGTVRLGDPGAGAIGGDIEGGPGVYRVRVTTHGRDEAVAALQALRTAGGYTEADLDRYAGVEQYRLELWRLGDSPAEEDD
ncbi:hypothetical protein GCM10010399_54550 [Dactylosporangium fulvum]|uniref:Uncharacterized protein n=1 Tax=Dactylosporangium fulvum TaxID=53359 RepID=A0ABY5WBV7_9ACTN|nr:hypothetical protein [Dactylosporangium fulvum]UWP86704.1 hypothetical protein Dfulv_21675 [Dactylosporangium fulvum]